MRMGLVLGMAACTACSGTDTTTGASAALCTEICAQLENCNSETDELDCREACEGDRAHSSAFWRTVHTCVTEDLSCDQIEGNEMVDCVRDGLREVSASSTARSVCNMASTKMNQCDMEVDQSEAEQECLEESVQASDALISASGACFAEPCDEIEDCIEETLDDFSTDGDDWEFEPFGEYEDYEEEVSSSSPPPPPPPDENDDPVDELYCADQRGSTCCQENDPCGWANDGVCDCGDACFWDYSDCG